MMFSRVASTFLFAVFCLFAFVAATPAPVPGGGGGHPTSTITVTAPGPTATPGQCNTGPVQCCNSVESSNSAGANLLLGLLGIVLEGVTGLIGLGCSPLSVVGVGGGNCNTNTVCCQNNNVGGLISVGCIPVIL